MKRTKLFQILVTVMAIFAVSAIAAGSAFAAGVNGTTLAGYKTIDICEATPAGIDAEGNPTPAVWRYSGEIAVWNEGVIDTIGLSISDFIEYKTGNKWIKAFDVPITVTGEIPAGTTLESATVFTYSVEGPALPGTIRNNASITILNHSGHLNKPFGPNPKVTYSGMLPPEPCPSDMGCTYTQGYWGNKPDVVWPTSYSRDASFFQATSITTESSKGQTTCTPDITTPLTWQQVMDEPVNTSQGYYQLAHQYVAAVLNQANGAFVPQGVQDTLDLAKPWLEKFGPCACTGNGSCGLQKDWAGVLDSYNNGLYPDGPPHCGDEEPLQQ